MREKEMMGVRLDYELANWIKDFATTKDCTVSDVIKEAIATFKQIKTLPDDWQFSDLLAIHGSKASIMTYRLLEKHIRSLEEGQTTINDAAVIAKNEFRKFRLVQLPEKTQ